MKKVLLMLTLALSLPLVALAEPTTFECSYPHYSDKDGSHKTTGEFTLRFIVDQENEKSYMVGNNGTSEVAVMRKEDGIAFLEITPSGNLMTTAIDNSHNSVHSRNTIIIGELVASQYYGTCKIK